MAKWTFQYEGGNVDDFCLLPHFSFFFNPLPQKKHPPWINSTKHDLTNLDWFLLYLSLDQTSIPFTQAKVDWNRPALLKGVEYNFKELETITQTGTQLGLQEVIERPSQHLRIFKEAKLQYHHIASLSIPIGILAIMLMSPLFTKQTGTMQASITPLSKEWSLLVYNKD